MKIRMLTLAAGPNGSFEAGHVYDVDRKTALEWIAARYAEPFREPEPARESAEAPASENAMAAAAKPPEPPAGR
jgi:hypothetical protein